MKKIYFDLDGVIRDLSGYVGGGEPDNWQDPMPNGRRLMEYVEANLECLYECPATKYYYIIRRLPFVRILTCQPEAWRSYTVCWIQEHFEWGRYDIDFVDHADEKLKMLLPGDILIEDYPMFKDYSQIALIDYQYNRNVEGEIIRIREPEELDAFLYMQRSSFKAQPQEIVLRGAGHAQN